MVKKLYKGVFIFAHQSMTRHTKAFSEKQAKQFFFRQIAKKHEVSEFMVADYFSEHKDKFLITEEE